MAINKVIQIIKMGKSKHATLTQRKKNQERMRSTELVTADEMQVYGMVLRSLGDKRFECICNDHVIRQCKIRGKFRGRLFVNVHDILLISLRETDDTKADIIQKYTPDQVHELQKMGEFTDKDFATDTNEHDGLPAANDDGLIVWTTEDIDKV